LVSITKDLDAARQPKKYLACVERHRGTRSVDQAGLKPAFRKLYRHQPIKHSTGAIEKIAITAPQPLINKAANDISRGFRV
jgi:hypothetical protein